jgi:hypothetical protein
MKSAAAFVLGLFIIAAASQPLKAQTPTGTLQGVVEDVSGAVVPDGKVLIINVETNETKELRTDNNGRYLQPFLLPGTYTIVVEKQGFRTIRQENVKLDVGQNRSVDLTLDLGGVAQEIRVEAAPPPVDTNSSTFGQNIENKRIADLPLNGRSALSLAALSPGVNPTGGGSTPHISGSQTSTSEVQIDGTTSVTAGVIGGLNRLVYEPQVDAVHEFSVQVNGLPAEYGRFAGGVINVVTKSGTNSLHGSLYEFLRNSVLDANNFFANRAGRDKGSFKRNQWGGTVGGPVVIPELYNGRDKTFFFFGFEGTNQRSQSVFSGTVPIQAWREGDFSNLRTASGAPITIYDPLTGRPDPADPSKFIRSPFEGNRIPANRLNPIAVNALKYFPQPNTPSTNPYTHVNNYIVSGATTSDAYRMDTRIDQNWTEQWRMFARVSIGWDESVPLNAYNNEATPNDGSGLNFGRRRSVTLDNVFSFTPTLIGNIRYGFGRNVSDRIPFGSGFDLTTLGFPASLNDVAARNLRIFPKMDFTGVLSSLGQNFTRAFEAGMSHTLTGAITKVFSGHNVKVGGEYRKFFVNYHQFGSPASNYVFSQGWTQQEISTVSPTSGSPIASFLLGLPASGSISHTSAPAVASSYFAGYVQDDWKLTSRLTLNLGLRYEVERPRTERFNRLAYFDLNAPSPIAGQVSALACPACGDLRGAMQFTDAENRRQVPVNYSNWGPRIGFAFAPDAKTSVRASYGITYPPSAFTAGGASIGFTGFNSSTSFIGTRDNMRTIAATLTNPFPEGYNFPLGREGGPGTNLGLGTGDSVIDRNRSPYVQQWNLTIQRALPANFVVEIGYIGSRGVNLIDGDSGGDAGDPLNQLPASAMSLGSELLRIVPNPFFGIITNPTSVLSAPTVEYRQLLRPYPQYSDVSIHRRPQAQSVYHAITLRVEKRFANGFSFLGSYTAGKSIDDGSAVAWWEGPTARSFLDHYNRPLERAISSWDVPQRLVLSYLYELPFGRGRRFLAGAPSALNLLVSGWQVNGISTFQSGTPVLISTPQNNTFIYTRSQRPNNNGESARITGGSTDSRLSQWFDTSVFSQPPSFTFGATGRALPDVRNPGLRNTDLSIFKNTYFGPDGRLNLQYRLEMFNAFNTPQFAAPGASLNTAAFGVISGTAVAPRQIQMALKLLW